MVRRFSRLDETRYERDGLGKAVERELADERFALT